MQTRKDDPIYPVVDEPFDPTFSNYQGLTKREYFAAAALQGILASPKPMPDNGAVIAVKMADALILELNKQPGRQPYEKPERI